MLAPTRKIYRLLLSELLVFPGRYTRVHSLKNLTLIDQGTPFFQSWMTTEELLKHIRIPPEYARIGDTPPQDIGDLPVQLERWRLEVVTRLRDLASHLAISGCPSTEEQSLLVVHVAQYIGDDPWVSNDVRSQAERTHLLWSRFHT